VKQLEGFWSDRIRDDEPSVFCVLAVESSHSLAQAWRDLVLTRRRFGRRSWLTSTSSGWLRTSELTWHRGLWHAHDNILVLGSDEQLAHVAEQIATKWASAASQAGVRASVGSQYVERSDNTGSVRGYIVKRMMGRGSRRTPGMTPGDIRHAMMQGDPDAFEAWQELEAFFGRRVPGNLISRSASLYDRQAVTHRAQVALAA
jgi:hypothetical protein